MVFLLNGKAVDALALIVHRASQEAVGRAWVKKLRESIVNIYAISNRASDKVIPRQLFEVPIQALIGKRVIARETLSAYRADVTAGLYGGENNLQLL
jgi:translation elongation factor EF-4